MLSGIIWRDALLGRLNGADETLVSKMYGTIDKTIPIPFVSEWSVGMQDNKINPYIRQAKYYETDQMAVIHHSNYVRWFEEARVDYLEQIGLGYDRIEAEGVYSPVLGISCEYKSSVRFHETVAIRAVLKSFNGIKMRIEYEVRDEASGQLRALGASDHCFVSAADFRPVSLKKDYKPMYDILIQWVEAGQGT